MDLSALKSSFRNQSGDHGVPALWDDPTVTAFLNEGEREAAERARLLYDLTTPAVCRVELLPDTRHYPLHHTIFDVRMAALTPAGGRQRLLCRAGDDPMQRALMRERAGWADFFATEVMTGNGATGLHLTIDRAPTEAGGFLMLSAYRHPLVDMEDDTDEPEIPERYHPGLVHWALHRAYQTRDMEGSAAQRSAFHEAEFVKLFGDRQDANVMRKQARHRPTVVRPARF